KRVRTKSVLFIHDLETGEEYPIYDKLNKDQQEAWAIFGVYPNFDWMPNDREIVFWSGGKINKIDLNTLAVTNIPFTVDVKIELAETVHFNTKIETETFTSKMIRGAVTSPNGDYIVFSALGHLYKKTLPNGEPKRLTNSTDFEFEPSFSPNGSEIVYVTWNDSEKGAVYKISTNGGTPTKLTSEKGIYRTPSYSQNGNMIVFQKEKGNTDQGFTFTKNTGIYTMDADGSNLKFIVDKGEYPTFAKDGKRIFL